MKICDLHTHSIYSDGTYTPTQIIDEAYAAGISCVALCDHNSVDGIAEFSGAAYKKGIEAVLGTEFSVNYGKKELHLLGLYLPEKYINQVTQFMADYNDGENQCVVDLVEGLRKLGYDIDYDEIRRKTHGRIINRAHIATELTLKGYTSSINEAFGTLLHERNGLYKEPERMSVWTVLAFIKQLGAVPVLAHPFLNLSEDELKVFLPEAKKAGLIGMECLYSTYDEERTKKSFALADAFGLKYSGGSDFHGTTKPKIKLGTGYGNLNVPIEYAYNLKPQE